jgi:hypothetical protein
MQTLVQAFKDLALQLDTMVVSQLVPQMATGQ